VLRTGILCPYPSPRIKVNNNQGTHEKKRAGKESTMEIATEFWKTEIRLKSNN
jgi:hypothetical protein